MINIVKQLTAVSKSM